MPANLYPYHVGDPILRTCRAGSEIHWHRVAQPSMCLKHPRTCMTCCNRMQRGCGLGPRDVPTDPDTSGPGMTWEERQADMARLNRELGFREYTAAEIAEDARRREHHG